MDEFVLCQYSWVCPNGHSHECIRVDKHDEREDGRNSPHLCHCGYSYVTPEF
jgi:hypothetical protein